MVDFVSVKTAYESHFAKVGAGSAAFPCET